MASELEEKWRSMTLTEAESDALVEELDELFEQLVAHSMVGKLMTNTPFNPEALKNTMRSLWKLVKGLVGDREKVLYQGPWSFDVYQIMVDKWRESMEMPIANKMGTFVEFDEPNAFG
ncbi:RNA-binding E3 ubiquitin-protein ligase MEX3C [Bienertia sinuspersici]